MTISPLFRAVRLVLPLLLAGHLNAADLTVSNVRAAQKTGTKQVDIYYDLSGSASPVFVRLQVSSNSGNTFAVPATTLTGHVGAGVAPGQNRKITWNAGADWNNQLSNTVKFRVTAERSLAFNLPDSSYSQSCYWAGTNYTAKRAFNWLGWNLGNYGDGWIQVDLGSAQDIQHITFHTGQTPNGFSSHRVYVSNTFIGSIWTSLLMSPKL